MSKRTFLFLQGGTSYFFRRLADKLISEGHQVHKINFNGGDRDYWGANPAFDFRGGLEDLPDYLEHKAHALGVTDFIVYNDRRPVNAPAITLARKNNLRSHVYEEGYFRPYFITLERDGVNGNSSLPRDPDWYRTTSKKVPDYPEGKSFSFGFRSRATTDIAYELANLANPISFPHYHSHVPYNRWIGYLAHLRRFAKYPRQIPRDRQLIEALVSARTPYYCLPLQLESDAQIRHYSSFTSMAQIIEHVMRSFAAHAPPHTRLVIKNHPHDPGFVNFTRVIAGLTGALSLTGRIDYLETGNTGLLLQHALGVVTVNSTTGLAAIEMARPTIVLGQAIYNLPGMAFQGSLDTFWRDGTPPDAELFRCFRNVVIHGTQVNGGYYTADAIELAVQNSWQRLVAEKSPLEELL